MIKLYIENQEAAISGASFTIVRDNPLITKAGDYTLDINLDLKCVENQIIFYRIKRFHSIVGSINKNAELLDNEKVLLRGTAILLKVENDVAKIQLVSNNSELNYIYDYTTRIRDLDFGTVTTRNATDAAKVSNGLYGDTVGGIPVHEAYPQLFKTDFSDLGSGAEILNYTGDNDGGAWSIWFNEDTPLRPQPYLLYYIDKLVEILGYTIGQCDIDRTKYRRLILVHGYDTNEYAKMLPDWTVSEFISEIEKFFNVVFYVDSASKVLDILSVAKFYQSVGNINIDKDDIIDERETDFGKDAESIQTSYKNVGYKLPSSEYWQFASMDEQVYSIASKINRSYGYGKDYDSTAYEILLDRDMDVEWVNYEDAEGENKYHRFVNQFAPVVKDVNAERTELKIIPAKILASYRIGTHGSYTFLAPVPVFYENNAGTFCNAIRNGVAETAGGVLQVAFYLGFCEYDGLSYGTTMCITTRWHQLRGNRIENVRYGAQGVNKETTLSLNGQYGRCNTELINNVGVDTTKLYTIKILASGWLDPRAIYCIDNRQFICKKLEYDFDNNGLLPVIKGEFYPMTTIGEGQSGQVDEVANMWNNIAANELSGKIIFFNYDLADTDVVMTGVSGNLSKNYLIEHIKSGQEGGSTPVIPRGDSSAGHAEMIGLFDEKDSADITWVRVIQFKNQQLQYDSDETGTYDNYFEYKKYRGGFFVYQNGIRYILFDNINPGERYDFIMHAVDGNGNKFKMWVGFNITA